MYSTFNWQYVIYIQLLSELKNIQIIFPSHCTYWELSSTVYGSLVGLTCRPVFGGVSAILNTEVGYGTATVRPLSQVKCRLGAVGCHKLELWRCLWWPSLCASCLCLGCLTGACMRKGKLSLGKIQWYFKRM